MKVKGQHSMAATSSSPSVPSSPHTISLTYRAVRALLDQQQASVPSLVADRWRLVEASLSIATRQVESAVQHQLSLLQAGAAPG